MNCCWRLLWAAGAMLAAGCGDPTGPAPTSGYRLEMVSYDKKPNLSALVLRVSDAPVAGHGSTLATITAPRSASPNQTLAVEGTVRMDDPDQSVRLVEIKCQPKSMTTESEHVLGGFSVQHAARKNPFRIEFQAPLQPGTYKLTIVVAADNIPDEVRGRVTYAEGELLVQ